MTTRIMEHVLSTLLVWCQQYNLVYQLSDFYRFDHHIYLVSSSIDLNRLFPIHPSLACEGSKLDNGSPKTVLTFGDDLLATDGNITEHATLKAISSKNTFLVVVVEGSQIQNGSHLFAQVKAIRKLDRDVKIGVLVTGSVGTSLDTIDQLFRWSWGASIVNIFCAFYLNTKDDEPSVSFNVFRYDPFGTFHLINVTGSESFGDYFPGKMPNYRQDPLRLLELRKVLKFHTEMRLIDTLLSALNASLLNITVDRVEFTSEGKTIGDLMHSDKYEKTEQAELMYPYRQAKLFILVPHAKPYSDFFAYLKNGTGTWITISVYTAIVVVASSLILIISGYLRGKKTSPLARVADVINLILNDNGAIRYRSLDSADIFVTLPLTFTGLIVMNGIVSLFKSFVTAPVYQPQMNTLGELYQSPVPILCEGILKNKARLPQILEDASGIGGWYDKIIGKDFSEISIAFFGLNNSMAQTVFDQQAYSLLELQRRLDKKSFHLITEPYLAIRLFTYRVRPDYPFVDAINDIIHRFHAGGLVAQWNKQEFPNMEQKFWKQNPRHIHFSVKSYAEEFEIPTLVWSGWIASVIAFICELIWNKIKLYQRRRRKLHQSMQKNDNRWRYFHLNATSCLAWHKKVDNITLMHNRV